MNTVTFTATSPGGSSRTETVTAEDFAAKQQDYNNHGWTVEVARPVISWPATWTAYQLNRTPNEVLQAAIKEVAQMLEAGEITKAHAGELIDFIK